MKSVYPSKPRTLVLIGYGLVWSLFIKLSVHTALWRWFGFWCKDISLFRMHTLLQNKLFSSKHFCKIYIRPNSWVWFDFSRVHIHSRLNCVFIYNVTCAGVCVRAWTFIPLNKFQNDLMPSGIKALFQIFTKILFAFVKTWKRGKFRTTGKKNCNFPLVT